MALSIGALLPHSPLLIPEIGRANYNFLARTAAAYEGLGQKLKAAGVSTVIVISPHGAAPKDAFGLNVAPEMNLSFQDFGFIPPKIALAGDALLAEKIKNAARPDFPLNLISEANLDYGSALPLYLLKKIAGEFKAISLFPAGVLSLEDHWRFGQKLGEVIGTSGKNLAVIASGDLSHRLKRKSPGGYSPKGAKFDNKLIEYLSEPTSAKDNILKMNPKLIAAAGECGLKPLVVLLGIMAEKNWQTEILAYQTDFGIGYLSVDFIL